MVRVGIGLCCFLIGCGGTSNPPSEASAGDSATGGSAAGSTGAGSTGAGGTGAGGVGASSGSGVGGTAAGGTSCDGCAGEPAVEQVCEPSTQYCEDNVVYACKPDGSGTMLWTACGTFYHCVELKKQASCVLNTCTPAKPVCDGNVLKTCTDEGTVPAKGKDCGDEVCDAAACKPRICEPSSTFCKDDAVYDCSTTGAEEFVSFTCEARQTCRDDQGDPECVSRICEPTKAACVEEVLGTCAADGLTLTSAGTDCGETDQVCDLVAGCGASAVDTLGKRKEAENFSSGDLATNMIDVRSARTLVEIETNWVLDQPRDLRFVVYELESDDLFHVRYDEIVSNDAGSGFFSSGPLDLPLKAGKRYLIGAGLVVGEGHAYYETSGWSGVTSFATPIGALRTFHTDLVGFGVNPASLYVLRLKTTAP